VEHITREHVEAWIQHLRQSRKAQTAANRYNSLHVFFKYLVDEDVIPRSPMEKMHSPRVDREDEAVLTDHEIEKLLAVCAVDAKRGNRFEGYRDAAILRVLIDTGCRVSELVGVMLERDGRREAGDLDLDLHSVYLHEAKNKRPREVGLSNSTENALDRYMRLRAKHSRARLPNLWIGSKGPIGAAGVRQILDRRAKQAGVRSIHPHLFRHTAAHYFKSVGGSDEGLMRQFGWKSMEMAMRYGASAASERSLNEHRRISPGDRFK
jgi:site-specific recombinase XerD